MNNVKFCIKNKKDIEYKKKIFKKGTIFEIEKLCDKYLYIRSSSVKIKVLLKDYEVYFYDKFV